jgi:hypothetical protein
LGGSRPESVCEVAGEVSELADVDGEVGVKGAGGDGEGVPLLAGDGGAVDEDPLAGFVVKRGFVDLDLDGICSC